MNAKQRMQYKLDELGFDFNNFSMTRFAKWLEAKRERQIFFLPSPMPATLCGAWISSADYPHEYILYDSSVPKLHQIHIQLHELSHFICDHPTLKVTRGELKGLIEALQHGEIPLRLFESTLRYSPDQKDIEEEAETLAILIQEQSIRCARLKSLTEALPTNQDAAALFADMGLI